MFARLLSWLEGPLEALRFLSRIPLPPPATPLRGNWAACLAWAPLAGLVIALAPVMALAACHALGLQGTIAAVLSIGSMILITGGLHEDGLADVADGFGGGTTRERKLAIMRDSRIGTYGTLALGLSLLLRVVCVEHQIARGGFFHAGATLVTAAVLSRAFMLVPMTVLPLARDDGLARAAGAVSSATMGKALIGGSAIAAVAQLWDMASIVPLCAAWFAGAAVAALMTATARRQIGGVTGDVAGATQQLAEIALLVALSADGPLG